MLQITGREKLQEYFFKKSIIEDPRYFGYPSKFHIRIDHLNGKNYLNDVEYPILFPKSTFDYVETISKEKKFDYYFKGVISMKRSWITEYSNRGQIVNSLSGRNPSTKYSIDTNYFTSMCESNFTLTPTGDCPWSYRLFESIMCFSIPILEDETNDVYHHMFKTYSHSENHKYDLQIVNSNFQVLKNNFIASSLI